MMDRVVKGAQRLAAMLKSAASGETEESTEVRDEFEAAVEDLRKAASEDVLEKAGRKRKGMPPAEEAPAEDEGGMPAEGDEDEDEDEEAPAEDSPVQKKKLKSRVEDEVNEKPEAAAALDVEPFLKALVRGIDRVLTEQTEQIGTLAKAMESLLEVQKASANVLVKSAEALREMQGTTEEVASQPAERKSRLSVVERFGKSQEDAAVSYDPSEARLRLGQIAKSKVLTPQQVAVTEGRINAGRELPDYFVRAMEGEAR